MSDLYYKGQEVQAVLYAAGEPLRGLNPISLVEIDGDVVTVWRVSKMEDMTLVDSGADVEIRMTVAGFDGVMNPCSWTGQVAGFGISGHASELVITISGSKRVWGEPVPPDQP